MTNRQAIWIGGGMVLGLFVWLVGTLGVGYHWYGGVNPIWLFVLAGAFVGWVVTKVLRIK